MLTKKEINLKKKMYVTLNNSYKKELYIS